MNYPLRLGFLVWVICANPLFAQSQPSSTGQMLQSSPSAKERVASHLQNSGTLQILSDTQSVDFSQYRQRVLQAIRTNWLNLMPEAALSPPFGKGKVEIEFAILRTGSVAGMKLISSSGDRQLDRAAWGGITSSNPFPPLPAEFTGRYLTLRFRFYYNSDPNDPNSVTRATLVTVLPLHADLAAGAKQKFSATVTSPSTADSKVIWAVAGDDCADAACGSVSGDGTYTAPSKISHPKTVTITATLASDPAKMDSATVNIQPNPAR
jgi:TonB family protein